MEADPQRIVRAQRADDERIARLPASRASAARSGDPRFMDAAAGVGTAGKDRM